MAIVATVIVIASVAVLDIVTVMAIKTNMASSWSFQTWTGYWIQETRSKVARSSSH